MSEQQGIKDRVVKTLGEHPDWTAKQIADHLGVERYHVYNNARAAGLTLAAAPMQVPPRPQLPAPASAPPAALPAPASDFVIFANNPADMIAAQRSMIDWCDERITVEAFEQEEAQRNLDTALTSGFSTDGWKRQVRIIGQKLDFYEKVKAALQAGYYIVPPFPIDMFAIRTKAHVPRGGWTKAQWRAQDEQSAQLLAAGEGRYVSPDPHIEMTRFEESDGKGGTTRVQHWRPDYFEDADFPFKLARGEILSATRAAMAMKVFDRLGVLPAVRAPDPIVCGQIILPHKPREALTFFVTWWLDTRTL